MSDFSDTCSETYNDNIIKVLKTDKLRYQSKGYGLISASIMVFVFFYFIPDWSKELWFYLMNICGYDGSNSKDEMFRFKFYLVMVLGGHIIFFATGQLMFLFLYKAKIGWFEKYKVNPTRAWPWDKDYQLWRIQLKKSLLAIGINQFIHLILMIFDQLVLQSVNMRMDLQSWPSKQEILKQIVFFMIMEDFLFYWSHRFLHLDFIYPYIHKKHHEFKDTISIASEYAHPIEAIIANIIPTSLGFKLLGDKCHLFTIVMWLALRITETIDGHSGYEFSWSPFRLLPFSGSSDSHSYHHSHNIGNYSSFFTFWDTICGTSKHYQIYTTKKNQRLNKQANKLLNTKNQ